MADQLDALSAACDRIAELKAALTEFVSTIDATGGCVRDEAERIVPAADEDWLDLGDAYLTACEALKREPKVLTAEGVPE